MAAWSYGWFFGVRQGTGYFVASTVANDRNTFLRRVQHSLVPLGHRPRCHFALLLVVTKRSREPRARHFLSFVRFHFIDMHTKGFRLFGPMKYQVYWTQSLGDEEGASEFPAPFILPPLSDVTDVSDVTGSSKPNLRPCISVVSLGGRSISCSAQRPF